MSGVKSSAGDKRRELARFSPEQVREIRRRAEQGESQRKIARDMEVSNSAIAKIVQGVAYSYID